jgi:twitching motility protein PilT
MDFHQLLTESAKRGASDLHLKSGSRPIVRVHGHLETQDDLPAITRDFMRKTAMTLLGEVRYNALMEAEEMDLAHTVPGVGRFRINVFLCQGDVRIALRHIPDRIPAFEELHLPAVLERLSMERRGMILVTGITGSGKTTTLAAMIDFMNRTRNEHIVTIEDPVEFMHEDKKCVISQREVGQDSTSFAQALRAALRQDPDVILVGEMRDAETMEVALQAAETGHLVLSTVHTLNAAESINRIISIFPPHQEDQIRGQLSGVLEGIISQRLVVRADGKGRVPAVEVLVATGLIRDSIRDASKTNQIPSIIAAGQAQYGMQTFDQSLLGLYRQELVTYETARDAATNPDDFDLKVKGIFSTAEMTWEVNSPGFVGAPSVGRPSAAPSAARLPAAPTAPPKRG